MHKTLLTEIDHGIGIVTLNCPARHNAMDDILITELTEALQAMETNPAVRIVVLSSTGKSFCAGADLNWMQRAAHYTPEKNQEDAMKLATLLSTLNQLRKPTIARVQGPAYGGGVGLIAACDIAISIHDVNFSLTEVRLGLIPAVISPYIIAAIGQRHARRYMLTAERFSAIEAQRMGLLHEIASTEEALDASVGEFAQVLLAGGPVAQAACKDLIRVVANQAMSAALIEDTASSITHIRASEEGREGIASFLEKREPTWVSELGNT